MRALTVVMALAVLGTGAGSVPLSRKANLVRNPGMEAQAKGLPVEWKPVGAGYEVDTAVRHEGRAAIKCINTPGNDRRGAMQVIKLDPPVKHPLLVSGWSKAEQAEGTDYCVWLDIIYEDGTPLWGQRTSFERGTHDWQYSERIVEVAKPVKEIQVFLLFRRATGTVWFDDVRVSPAPFEFRGLRVLPGLYGGVGVDVAGGTTIPARWEVRVARKGTELWRQGGEGGLRASWDGRDSRGKRQPAGRYEVTVRATDTILGETIMRKETITAAGGEGRGFAAWTAPSTVRVMPQALPEKVEPAAARIALAGREYESFQIVLLRAPDRDPGTMTVKCGELRQADGAGRIAAENITWHQVGFVKLEQVWPHPKVVNRTPGWWPDPLLPVETFTLGPNEAQAIWVTVYCPPGTPAGEYRGMVTVQPERGEGLEVPVSATVYGFDLPVQGHLKTAFALMDGYLEKIYGRPLTAKLRQAYGDYLLAHRLNPDDISRTDPPALEDLEHYYHRGLNAFNVLNMVQERGNRTWVCWSPLKVYTPEFKQHLIERLDPYVAELRKRKLIDKAYIYTFDERGEDFYPVIKEYFGMVKERYPEIHTLTTAKVAQDPGKMKELNVDWNCPLTARYKLEEADRCRAAGLEVWAYVCLGPRFPYANWLADDPLIEARVIWWQAFQQKMDGFLYWGLNIWHRAHNDHIIDPAQGPKLKWSITTGGRHPTLHGDGELLYPLKDGPAGCIRLENIRDGLEDYEYLWLLGERLGSRDEARKRCEPVTTSLTEFTRDSGRLYAQRDKIAREIERLK